MAEVLRVCHDRPLDRDLDRQVNVQDLADGERAVEPDIRKLWVNGSNLRVHFLEGTSAQKRLVETEAGWWTQHANLTFQFVDDPTAEIRISFDPSDGAWSRLGTDATFIPEQEATMNLGFLDGGTVAHEFGHAIGLGHEHQNPQGGIEWNEDVVIQALAGPPNRWNAERVRHNVLRRYEQNQYLRGTAFDPASIMLYFFPGTWVKSGVGTKANQVLSSQDQSFIASAHAYPNKQSAVALVEVDADKATEAAIGAPGEEDLFQFQVANSGRYIVETGGETDTVMKLFGPDSRTRLIDEDDDGGQGLNARIATDLMAGSYFVQIRHYNRTKGTGSYTLRVHR
jgi:hypothetical protein